jgi:hypothetical protein
MADDKTQTRPHDSSRIKVHKKCEFECCTKRFGVSPEALRAAVEKFETSVSNMEAELQRR